MNKFNEYVVCPVPRDQRPFYEYIKRRNSSLLGCVRLNEVGYTKKFFFNLLIISVPTFFVITWFLSFSYYPVKSIILTLILSLIIDALIYFNFLLAWKSTGDRLFAPRIAYEESGGPNGKTWTKPPSILKHERLLYLYQLIPLINRLKNTLQIIFLATFILLALLCVLMY